MIRKTPELYIGLMSGTSMDAIDAALIDFSSTPPRMIATHSEPMPHTLKKELIDLCSPGKDAIIRMGKADHQLGHLFANSALCLLEKTDIPNTSIRAIGSHGQTIYHSPRGDFPFTLQIGDPNIIAAITNITTVADFRRRDMALGGEAAPLAPAFHNFLLRTPKENRWVLNIGGIANITYLAADTHQPVLGFDTGPGNTLLDSWCAQTLGKAYDDKGALAASGKVNASLLKQLLSDPYFSKKPPKSTGREYFNLDWLKQHLASKKHDKADIQSTLLELTIESITRAIKNTGDTNGSIWVCGGGIHNTTLMKRLRDRCSPLSITTTESAGIHPDWIEAACFAWLAKQTLDKKPGNLPSVTGAKGYTVLGAIFLANH